MGCFGAVFGCRGDGGFNGCCSGTRSGVVGFNVAMLLRLVREKVRPAWSDGGREREKVRPARSKHPKIGVFALAGRTFSRKSRWRGCAGRVFSRKCQWRGCAGRTFSRKCRWRGRAGRVFSRRSALRPGLVGDVAHEAGCRWGFCSIRSWLAACRRRVVPLMTPFPPFGDGLAEPPPIGLTCAGTCVCRHAVKPRRQTITPGHSSPAGLSTPRR